MWPWFFFCVVYQAGHAKTSGSPNLVFYVESTLDFFRQLCGISRAFKASSNPHAAHWPEFFVSCAQIPFCSQEAVEFKLVEIGGLFVKTVNTHPA